MPLIYTFDVFFCILSILLSVAFFTLVERKVMSYMHYRKGPNKVLYYGLFQPFPDAIKLLTKENVMLSFVKLIIYLIGPLISIFFMLMYWNFLELTFMGVMEPLKLFYIILIMSLSFYGMLFMSWGSNSKYSLMGGYRSLAQVISYEVCLIMFLFFSVFTMKSYTLSSHIFLQEKNIFLFMFLPMFMSWFIICLAESNRSPFDISEGESEIVSGFNIEYGGGLFAIIFISEYGAMIFMSFFTIFLLTGISFILLKVLIICFFFIWLRCSFPRIRYDSLMLFSWKHFILLSGVLLMIVM